MPRPNLAAIQKDLERLTNWALVSFTGRCAERALIAANPPAVDRSILDAGLRTVFDAAAGDLAARARGIEMARTVDQETLRSSGRGHDQDVMHLSNGVGLATWSAGVAYMPGRGQQLRTNAFLVARDALSSFRGDRAREMTILRAMRSDLSALIAAGRRYRWTESDPVPDTVYATLTRFDLLTPVNGGDSIVRVNALVNARLTEHFLRYPRELYRLGSRQFEMLIAELFDGFGFDVELTRPTRDGGRDIIAVKNRPTRIKFLIEAKKYGPEERIGVAVARGLLGVVVDDRATKGIVATTSPSFTREASRFFERNNWMLEGRAFDDVLEWLRDFDALKLRISMGMPPDPSYIQRRPPAST